MRKLWLSNLFLLLSGITLLDDIRVLARPSPLVPRLFESSPSSVRQCSRGTNKTRAEGILEIGFVDLSRYARFCSGRSSRLSFTRATTSYSNQLKDDIIKSWHENYLLSWNGYKVYQQLITRAYFLTNIFCLFCCGF